MGDSQFIKIMALGAMVLGVATAPVAAQDVDEVIVTGSYIKHTPEDAPVPVDVVDSEELFNIGSPSVVELVKTLGVSSGVDGETNQFQSNGLEGTANINLRGLGAGRNLVLLNGRRNVWSPGAISEQQQLFVDINMIPGVAIDRIELLKDGAAATYGSDAISGVVNFITRDNFEGFEVAVSHKEIDGSDGDQDFGAIWGHNFGGTHIMAAFSYNQRNKLRAADRDWAVQPYAAQGNDRGYTGIPNPGSFFPVNYTAGTPGSIGIVAGGIRDPRCTDFIGGASVDNPAAARGNCTYNYVYFDNLIEDEERQNIFATLTHDINDNNKFSVEFLYGQNEVPNWNTSPSYPPQVLVDTNLETGRIIPSYHPGLLKAAEDYPANFASHADETCTVAGPEDSSCSALIFFGRPFGVSGPPNEGSREHETTKLTFAFEGETETGLNYNLSALWSAAERTGFTNDTYIERWNLALKGFGGANCTGNTPGANGCEFYNPFSNAIETPQSKYAEIATNPDYDPSLANSAELRNWLQFGLGSDIESDLAVFEGVLSGEIDNGIGWAVGAQYREEEYVVDPFEGNDLTINPCITTPENERWRQAGASGLCDRGTPADTADDYDGSGQFGFLAGATPFGDTQDITAVFAEAAIPYQNLEAQISVRYEDYGGEVGDTIDPKVAVRWVANDNWIVRGSASTTFRGPTLNQLGGRSTSLSFVGPTSSFKAVDTFGQPDLEAESADTANLGVLYSREDAFVDNSVFNFSIDYWSFDFENPIIKESFNAVIANAFSGPLDDPTDPTSRRLYNPASSFADKVNCDVSCEGLTAASVQRISVDMINGPQIETDGFDIKANYSRPLARGDIDVYFEYTLISSYDVGESVLSDSFDALGKINDSVSYLRPIIENKWKLGATYSLDVHTLTGVMNVTGDYEDRATGLPGGEARDVDEHTTFDLHYNLSLEDFDDRLAESAVFASIYNLTDEDPPFARLDLNYDPYTHNPFGTIIKVGIRHKF